MKYETKNILNVSNYLILLLSFNFVACTPQPEIRIIPNLDACLKGSACDLTPVTDKVGVVTILLALGDIAQDKQVISESSGRLIAQNAVKFASPIVNPKILVVKDYHHGGES